MTKDDRVPANYPDDESYQAAVEGFLDYIRQNYFRLQGKSVYGTIVSIDLIANGNVSFREYRKLWLYANYEIDTRIWE
jgi:hypothetical protein